MTRSSEANGEIAVTDAPVPLSHELLWSLEWLSLRLSKVYRGDGVPHGHGEPIIVVPGFLGSFRELHELTDWLTRIGYPVSDPGFRRNASCPDTLLELLVRRIRRVYAAHGQRVSLVGHSLGGSLARAAAVRVPDKVEQVITLGSPLREMRAHPLVAELARVLAALAPSPHLAHQGHEHGPTCSCELAETLAQPFPEGVRRTAIYSRFDGVVDWRTCNEGDAGIDVEVTGTHIGLVVNTGVYETIARRLAGRASSPRRDAIALAGGETPMPAFDRPRS
jgi:pimeloyl-ACP methyl ester carboxylesterase